MVDLAALRRSEPPTGDMFAGDRPLVPRAVSDHLQAMILRGGLKPGEKLPSQRDLAEQLGVSRPSLREAISVLEAMGLVNVRIGSGVYVTQPATRAPLWRFSERCSPQDVYEARYGLESHAARLAALRCDEAGVARLREATDAMREALALDDIPAMAGADATFHDLVFDLTANPVLAGMYRPVRDMMVETQRLPMTLRIRLGDTLREHENVCKTIASRDGDGAEAAMRHHIRAAANRYGLTIG
ncbi:FadR/GntR family transcriptional regulator [Lichenihabitans psoromatis]|uniref:FadR/GntR family transcriptional regulator n=1 Tax=Lichenihabitans psoromatis TaxID=2528642 RepID=UPI001035D7B6|nr:FadR/GntR family transcriptional regulator [Lichenihabitans psoromatis]